MSTQSDYKWVPVSSQHSKRRIHTKPACHDGCILGVTITIILHFITGVPITTMVGILSGAVTNTPGLGAAQQANSDLNGIDAPEIALGYAVAYPLGVVGCILSLLALKYILRINTKPKKPMRNGDWDIYKN